MKKISTGLVFLLILSLLLPMTSFAHGNDNGNNDQQKGSLTIHKYEQEPGSEQGDPNGREVTKPVVGDPLEGVTYSIVQTHAYSAEDDSWSEVEDEEGFSDEKTTDANGLIELTGLELGRYKIQEENGPPHVNLNTDEFFVDIPMTNADGSNVHYDVHIYPKNELIKNDVELTKVDGDKDKDNKLQGVKFGVYDANTDEELDTGRTNENGKLKFENLYYGNYYLKEMETLDGYVLGDQRYEFSVEDSTSTLKYTIENFVEPELEKTVDKSESNRGEVITYSITSVLPGDIHEYNSYVITDELDENLSYVDGSWKVDGVEKDAFDFTPGQTLTWEISDFTAFKGVEEVTISFDAEISEKAPANEEILNKAKLEFENKHGNDGEKKTDDIPVLPTVGYILVIKSDGETDDLLPGAEFRLTNLNTEESMVRTTDENGEIDFGELDFGDYELVETKAPMYTDEDGVDKPYNKLNNPLEITIDSPETYEAKVKNYKSGWELPQTGGIGTSIFTIVGLLLMGGAAYLFFRRRNKDVAQ